MRILLHSIGALHCRAARIIFKLSKDMYPVIQKQWIPQIGNQIRNIQIIVRRIKLFIIWLVLVADITRALIG